LGQVNGPGLTLREGPGAFAATDFRPSQPELSKLIFNPQGFYFWTHLFWEEQGNGD